MLPLAPLGEAALGAIVARDDRLLELGAGEGLWAQALRDRGADVIALDPVPRGPGVLKGSHLDAQRYPGRSLLICWPPDGIDLDAWVSEGRRFIFLIGSHHRFRFAPPGPPEASISLLGGCKPGPNELRVYRLLS